MVNIVGLCKIGACLGEVVFVWVLLKPDVVATDIAQVSSSLLYWHWLLVPMGLRIGHYGVILS